LELKSITSGHPKVNTKTEKEGRYHLERKETGTKKATTKFKQHSLKERGKSDRRLGIALAFVSAGSPGDGGKKAEDKGLTLLGTRKSRKETEGAIEKTKKCLPCTHEQIESKKNVTKFDTKDGAEIAKKRARIVVRHGALETKHRWRTVAQGRSLKRLENIP